MIPEESPRQAAAPRPAATVLLVRDGGQGLEVFMVVRHRQIEFASGALVFPGGAVEPEDFALAAGLAGSTLPAEALALRVAAVRETFEECGILLARRRGAADLLGARDVAELAGRGKSISFGALVASEHLELALDLLVPFAHWITPPILPKRFDTHFFVAIAPPGQLAAHDGSESVDSAWLGPIPALKDAEAGRYTILLPTRLNLEKLGREPNAASVLAAARSRPIVTVLPEAMPLEDGKGLTLKIPLEAGYGGEVFTL